MASDSDDDENTFQYYDKISTYISVRLVPQARDYMDQFDEINFSSVSVLKCHCKPCKLIQMKQFTRSFKVQSYQKTIGVISIANLVHCSSMQDAIVQNTDRTHICVIIAWHYKIATYIGLYYLKPGTHLRTTGKPNSS